MKSAKEIEDTIQEQLLAHVLTNDVTTQIIGSDQSTIFIYYKNIRLIKVDLYNSRIKRDLIECFVAYPNLNNNTENIMERCKSKTELIKILEFINKNIDAMTDIIKSRNKHY